MNKKILLKCWSSNPDVYSDIAAAVVHVDSGLREMAWELAKLRQVVGRRVVESNFGVSAVSLNLSLFHPCPDFIGESEEREQGEGPFKLEEILDATYRTVKVVDISSIDDKKIDRLSRSVGGTRIHVFEEGLYWTTYPRCCDRVQIATATLTWKELELK